MLRGNKMIPWIIIIIVILVINPIVGLAETTEAPGHPGERAAWTTGQKQGVGTAANTNSKTWYTLSEGVLSEVYYPRVDIANIRQMEFLVTDGRTFIHRETADMDHRVRLMDEKALVYQQINTDRKKRYRLTKTYVTDPVRNSVVIRVDFESLDNRDYQLFAMLDTSIGNDGGGDKGGTKNGTFVASDKNISTAWASSIGFGKMSTGYVGVSDGWTDLQDRRMDWTYTSADDGNIVHTAEIPLQKGKQNQSFTMSLGFGNTEQEAVQTATKSLSSSFTQMMELYQGEWHKYLTSIHPPRKLSGKLKHQYWSAIMQLKAHEDKTFRGANIASLTIPWGEAVNADTPEVGGYHLVWARDLYQVATAMQAAGDSAAAKRALRYLLEVQQQEDGSFPQNSRMDGTPYWTGIQLDQVAYPLILAWQLGETDRETYENHLKPAADYIVNRGPSTPQERWEEEMGYSPSTIAAEIAGLICVADIAEENGDQASADLYTGVADDWANNIEKWTFTKTGGHGDGEYFIRIDQNGNPDDGAPLEINNGGGTYDERNIVDGGFLELVRLGVKGPFDPSILASLPELDQTIKVNTPHGSMWYRYNHDGYGEKEDGSPYNGTGMGRLWPILTGERGEYELAAGKSANAHLQAMAGAANEGFLIPEQVWDQSDSPKQGLQFGEGTGSATPLAWSMAQYVRLAHSIEAGEPIERPRIVKERYVDQFIPVGPKLTIVNSISSSRKEDTVRVMGSTNGQRIVIQGPWGMKKVEVVQGRFTVEVPMPRDRHTLRFVSIGKNGGTTLKEIEYRSQ
ncbi:glucoamylase [Thermoactinomyces sp. DSM 45891]|nr:glucoamylase [Thermoactinomyces sp. DSM 45891]